METIKSIKFVIRCRDEEPRVIVVDTQKFQIIKIGNDLRSHVRLDHDSVSRMHAVIEVGGEKATLIDLGSTEGALVNGKGIAKEQLYEGNIISIGPFRIQVYFNQTDLKIPVSSTLFDRLSSADSEVKSIQCLVFVVRRDGEVVKILRSEVPYHGQNLIIGCGGSVSPLSLDDAPGVEQVHAMIRYDAGNLSLLDLGTVSGTRLNGALLAASDIKSYDVIGIGPYMIQMLVDPGEDCIPVVGATPEQTIGFLIQKGTRVEKRVFPVRLAPGSNVFGLTISRNSDADIQLEGEGMAGLHALVCYFNDAFSFANVSPVYPTTLNGVVFDQHMQSSPLKDGDVIGAGDYRIQVFINPKKEDFERLQESKEEPNADPEDLATENARLKRELAEALGENRQLCAKLEMMKTMSVRVLMDAVIVPSVKEALSEMKGDLDGLIGYFKRLTEPQDPKKPKE